ncbi:MAG: 30S ribosomal protein S16 [Thermomicrobiales bacterium]|nr:30S ribosomal protein S16 [Thermomicrobiales bacterium]MCA9876611.1 30S ribosomal protein S16 [Thermomicrobiales bacterium]
MHATLTECLPWAASGQAHGQQEEQFRVVKLRLRRMGAKKRPSYRIVAADSRSPRDGDFIETVGFYDPLTEPSTIKVDIERARHWLSVGAQPTDTVRSLLTRAGVYGEAEVAVAAAE